MAQIDLRIFRRLKKIEILFMTRCILFILFFKQTVQNMCS